MANLIGFDLNRENVEFRGPCKLSINFMSKYLFVEPKNEAFKLISASFKWKYVMKKNILFVFAEHSFLDFCLVFRNEQICKKTFDYINPAKNDTDTTTDGDSIDRSFINPIFEAISINAHINSDLIETIAGWHQLVDESDEEKYSNLMKEFYIYDLIMTAVPTEQQQKKDIARSRKRKFTEIKKEMIPKKEIKTEMSVKTVGPWAKNIPASQFQLFSSQSLQKLIIYASNQKETFHEYSFVPNNNEFKCVTCDQIAAIDIDESGEFCVKLENDKHLCNLFTQIPSNYLNIKLIQKPDYQIFENCATFSSKFLVVFVSDDRNQCYQYLSGKSCSKFYCLGCYRSKLLNKSSAMCYDYVLEPNFEIQKFRFKGKEGMKLVVFDSNDRRKCYRYFYECRRKKYYCSGCYCNGKSVAAKLHQNSEGEEYVILSNFKHTCEMKTYVPNTNMIFRAPEIEVMEETKNGKPRVFLFQNTDRSKCYIFNRHDNSRYYCVGCKSKSDWKRKQKKQNIECQIVRGSLLKEENGEYSFQMKPNQNHTCESLPYQPRKYEIKTSEFFYYRVKKESKPLKLAIYSPENSQECFTFVHKKCQNNFVCIECRRMKKTYTIKPQKDVGGKEYYNHDSKKHSCQPIKVSTIPKYNHVKEHGISFQSKKKMDESKIVRMPNFKLLPNKAGDPDKKLIIFHSEDKTLCYNYYFINGKKIFLCGKCEAKKAVSAKLHTDDENGESFILMGKNDHICQPVKHQPL